MNKIGIRFEAITTGIKQKIRTLMGSLRKETSTNSPNINIKENITEKEKKIESLAQEIDYLRANIKGLDADLKKGGKTSSEYTSAITKSKKELRDTTLEQRNLRKEVKALKGEDLPGYFNNLSKNLGETIKRIGLFTAAFTIINQTKNALIGSATASLEFESALAGVNKTIDATASQLEEIDNALIGLSKEIPLTYVELAKIAEIGGQLGIPREQILQFTETMAQLKATTNLTSEEAIINFAKFNNVLGVTGEDISKVGSVLAELGNNSATTETQILTFGRRIAASGKLAGLTADEVLAVGAAFSSAGIEAEAGGTAVQKVLLSIATAVREGGSNLELYAQTAGKSAQEFQKYWKEDAGNAFADFVAGLGREGDKSFDILEQLGEDNVRTVRAFLSTANSAQTLSDAVSMANNEFKNGTALLDEFNIRADTNASNIQTQGDRWRALGKTLGDIIIPLFIGLNESVLKTIEGTGELIKFLKENNEVFAILAGTIGLVATNHTASLIPSMTRALGVIRVTTTAISAQILQLGLLGTATKAASVAMVGLTGALAAFRTALLFALGPIGAITLGITGIAYAWRDAAKAKALYDGASANTESVESELADSITESATELNKLKAKKLELEGKSDKSSQKELENTNKLIELENARLRQYDLIGKSRGLQDTSLIDKEKRANQEKIDQLEKELGLREKINKEEGEIPEIEFDLGGGGGGGETSDSAVDDLVKELEKAQKAVEDDNKKRREYLDKFHEYESTQNVEQAQKNIDFTKKALEKILLEIETAEGEKLDYYIDTADKYKKIIEENTKVVEKAAEKEEDYIKSVYDILKEKNKEAKDGIKEYQDEIAKLQEFQEDSSTEIAERQLEIEEKRLEVLQEIKDLEREGASLQAAESIGLDTLKNIGEGEVGAGYDVKNLIKILELSNEINALDKELAINKENVDKTVLEQVKNYEELTETEKMLQDQEREKIELLEDIEGGYKNIDEAIEGIREKQQAQQDELEANSRIAEQLQKKYTSIVGEETEKQGEYIDAYTQKVIRLIQKQRELNSLTNSNQSPSSSGNTNNSNISTTNNININGASNPYDTGRQVAKVTQAGARGAVVSNNS